MDEPRIVELPPYRVVRLRYEGPPPPNDAFSALWRRLDAWAEGRGLKGASSGVWAIGYAPPGRIAAADLVYDACIPVEGDVSTEGLPGLELAGVPGGRFVLCNGDLDEMPALLRAARRFAMSHGLPIERGHIERYLAHPDDPHRHPVEAGHRIHD
jgi:DNA gyrase inhibitor GyrI